MEFPIYIFIAVAVLGLGLLSIRDRIFGILGMIVAILGGIYMMSDATLVTNRVYDPNTLAWLGYSVPFAQVQLLAIVLGLFAIFDFFIVIALSR